MKGMLKQASIKLTIIALVFCGHVSHGASAQNTGKKEPIVVGGDIGIDGTDCETVKALLDLVAVNSATDKSIIIIATQGGHEPSRKINGRRSNILSSYLERARGIPKQRVISAEGERERGSGRVKIYVGGELQVIFIMKRNKDFAAGCDG